MSAMKRCSRASVLAGLLIVGLPAVPALASDPPVFTAGDNYPNAAQDVIANGDVNGDGHQDLITIEYTTDNTVSVMLGVGDGTFQKPAVYTLADRPGDVTTGDLNGDGRADVVTANEGGTMSVLLGLADGGLSAPVDYAIGVGGKGVALGDVNGDGTLDAVTGSYLSDTDSLSVLMGNGDGTFTAAVNYPTQNGTFSGWLALTDMDKDGDLDVVSCSANGLLIWPNNGDGTFDPYAWLPTGDVSRALAVGDVNNDGFPDVAFTNLGGQVNLALNDTTGLLSPPVTVDPGLSGFGISLADFNADSNLDLVTSTDANGSIDVLTGDGTGAFGSPLSLPTAQQQQTQVAVDLNSDGLADIAGVNAPATTVFLNAAAPTITGVSPAKGPVAGGTTLTLTGTGFLPGTTVTIGGKPALEVTVVSGATITLRTPQASAGPVDIVVTRTDGRSVTKAGAFTYELPPIPPPPPPPSPPPTTAPPTPTPSPTLREQLPIKPLNLPKRLKNVGVTRIVKVPVRTNAGQNAGVRVTGVARQLQGEVRVFRVFRRDAAVWVKLSGTQGMRVRVRVHADAMPGFTAYTAKKVYVTKAVR